MKSEKTNTSSKYEQLKTALLKAKKAAQNAWQEDDGGTCNFDMPVINYRAMHYAPKKAIEIIKGCGLDGDTMSEYGHYWSGCINVLILGINDGQGNRRTRIAEAFCNSLNSSGIKALMYYQAD